MGQRGPKPSCECGRCSRCLRRARELRWRNKTPEKQRDYRAARKVYLSDYRQENRERLNAADLARYHASDEAKTKHNARLRVGRAVANGTLSRGPCERCGCSDVQAHHDDYSKPLDVRWLCVTCHAVEHSTKAAA